MFTFPTKHIFAACALALTAVGTAQAQTLLVNWNFDEGTGTAAADSSGNGTSANLTLGGTSTWSLSTPYSAANSGQLNGYSFSTNGGATANHAVGADADKLDGLSQFSITGWINLQTAAAQFDRIFGDRSTGTGVGGYELIFNASNQLQLIVGAGAGSTLNSSTTTAFSTLNTWVFVAVTYNGAATSNNVNFYTGSVAGTATLLSTGTLNQGTTLVNSVGPRIGGVDPALTVNDRTPNAYIDDIRIYSGILNLAAIQGIQSAALAPIPEPSSIAALMGVFVGGCAAYRRRGRGRSE